ncbi:MAG: penicillin-binding protein 2 [Candidatus Symbiothrix sp.]|jgi:penicillin-binding protein 2|nr:penicillin-binding protein 2 [Candidatus Symbiothrix sp.]
MERKNFDTESRKNVLICIVCIVVVIYLIQLFRLQIIDPDYKDWADSNAFLKQTRFPSRGVMYDRNGKLMVYNQPSYDVMVVVREVQSLDTAAFCKAVGITQAKFRHRMAEIKNRWNNPGYSSYTPQVFLTQLGNKEYGILQESLYKFHGFYIQNRTAREYSSPYAAHVVGYVAEADKKNIAEDPYYKRGDYIGKTGVEKSYEPYLRGEKGVEILLRDAHGRIKGKYEDGIYDVDPVSGKDLTLSIDMDLQAYGEELMKNKSGSILMIEPKTGEILCMVSSPTYDPASLVGRQFGEAFSVLAQDPYKPLLNRAMNGTYPPGSTFKPAQALTFLQENIIQPSTSYSCAHGWPLGNGHPGCHDHAVPLSLIPAIGNSCNSYFPYGLKAMMENKKYGSIQVAVDKWRDYMVAQGFGYPLGVDMPGEKRGMIPNSQYYNTAYKDRNGISRWNAFTIISIAIGQGEILLSPVQICNLAVTIANRGYFNTPHIVKEIKDTPLDTLYTRARYTGIDPSHYETIAAGMRWAVNGPGGTCHGANIPDIAVCGKTGTAQNSGRDHSIFMGFAPYEDPQVSVMVFVENGGFGAYFAVPIGRLMIEKYLKGEIPPADKWIENNMKNASVPFNRNVIQKN